MANVSRPAIPAPPYHGGCLCAQVRYRIDGPPLAVSACHCTDCRKLTGVANLLMVLVATDSFVKVQGQTAAYRKTADSGRQSDIVRCAMCGVRMWHEPLVGSQYRLVAAGTLDDPSWAVPTAHIWTKHAPPGTVFLPDALMVEGQPADRQATIDAFTRLYG
jgi:hypothetical protein